MLLRKRRSRAVPPSGGRRARQTPYLTLGGFRVQRASSPAGVKVVHIRARSCATPPQGCELFQAASLPVDVVTGPGEPDGPVVIGESGL